MDSNTNPSAPIKAGPRKVTSLLCTLIPPSGRIFLLMLIGWTQVMGADFQATYLGETIYYTITSSSVPYQVSVTYGSSPNTYNGSIIIPSMVSYNGTLYTVTGIGDSAFCDCTGLISVKISESISYIGSYAFSGCTDLDTLWVEAPTPPIANATTFDYLAFRNTTVTVPCQSLYSYGTDSLWNSCDTLIAPAIHTTLADTLCYGGSYLLGSQTITTSGVYNDTTINATCDNITTLNLTILPNNTTTLTTTTCQQLQWGDSLYIHSGTYIHQLTASNGCDSLSILNLTITPAHYDTIAIDTCSPYHWYGLLITTDTTLTDTLQTTTGCDSILTTNLHLYNYSTDTLTLTACDNYMWNNTTFGSDTIVTQHLQTANGCDSTQVLILTINHSYAQYDTVNTCNSYTWEGIIYTTQNNTTHTIDTSLMLQNASGCDSLLQLHLTLNANTVAQENITACNQYTWPTNGETYFINGTYTHIIPNTIGCDSIITLNLNIVMSYISEIVDSFCTGTSYYFYDTELTRGGYYSETFTSNVAPYCDSVEILYLTELNKPTISISTHFSCDTLEYKISSSTNVDYFYWTSNTNDPSLNGQEHQHYLTLKPTRTTQYTLYADYLSTPTCPNSKTITLAQLRQPRAEIDLSPEQLTLNQLNFTAIDRSADNTSRNWYIDNYYYGKENRIEYTASTDVDSVVLMLEAYNENCFDTTYKTLYIRKESLYIPNAFTPKESTNNIFMVKGNGIIQYEIYIYNRNGLLVYHSTNMNEGWNGTFHNNPCSAGAYTYIINYHDIVEPQNPKQTKGSILIVR